MIEHPFPEKKWEALSRAIGPIENSTHHGLNPCA